jgi:hypothetical protein
MTVVYWANPLKQRQGGLGADTGRTKPTKLHVSRDGEQTVCGYLIQDGAVVVDVTPDWHEHANCYNKGNLPRGWLLPATPDAEVDLRCIGSPALIASARRGRWKAETTSRPCDLPRAAAVLRARSGIATASDGAGMPRTERGADRRL